MSPRKIASFAFVLLVAGLGIAAAMRPETAAAAAPMKGELGVLLRDTTYVAPSGVKFHVSVGISEPVVRVPYPGGIWRVVFTTISPSFGGIQLDSMFLIRTVDVASTQALEFSSKGYPVGAVIAEGKSTLKEGKAPAPSFVTPPAKIVIGPANGLAWGGISTDQDVAVFVDG